MPRISRSQIQGELAVNKIISLCNEAGWICEIVSKDFGEDIQVQANFNGVIDSFRIWIQVKGYGSNSYKTLKDGTISLFFDRDHLNKWTRSSEMILIVIYDHESDLVRYSIPRDQFLHIYARDPFGKRGKNIKFYPDSIFNLDSIKTIEWQARLDFYSDQIIKFEAIERHNLEMKEFLEDDFDKFSPSFSITFAFGVDLGLFILHKGKLSLREDILEGLIAVRDRVLKGELEYDNISTYLHLSVLGYVNDFTGVGVPYWIYVKLVQSTTLMVFGVANLPRNVSSRKIGCKNLTKRRPKAIRRIKN